jgi:hypothetical protein
LKVDQSADIYGTSNTSNGCFDGTVNLTSLG